MQIPGSKWISGTALGVAVSVANMTMAQATANYAMGECKVTTPTGNTSRAQIDPTSDAGTYMMEYVGKSNPSFKKYVAEGYTFRGALTRVLIKPKHGELVLDNTNNPNISTTKEGWYVYVTGKGFSGEDTFIIQVKKYGLKINIQYKLVVPGDGDNGDGYCKPEHWKISQTDVVGSDDTDFVLTTLTPEDPEATPPLPVAVGGRQ